MICWDDHFPDPKTTSSSGRNKVIWVVRSNQIKIYYHEKFTVLVRNMFFHVLCFVPKKMIPA